MRIVQLFFLTLMLFGCRTETDELLGHWHSVPMEDGYFWTLDVSDSTTQINKFDILNRDQAFRRFDEEGNEAIVFLEEEYEKFEIRNDTIFLNEIFKFIRFKDENKMNDRFLGSLVQLNLQKTNGITKVELPRLSQLVNLYIGPPKNQPQPDELINSDSTSFQTLDVLATFSDLENFARFEDGKIGENMNNWLAIHADSSTSATTIDSILTILEPLGIINGYYLTKYNYTSDELVYEELTEGNRH